MLNKITIKNTTQFIFLYEALRKSEHVLNRVVKAQTQFEIDIEEVLIKEPAILLNQTKNLLTFLCLFSKTRIFFNPTDLTLCIEKPPIIAIQDVGCVQSEKEIYSLNIFSFEEDEIIEEETIQRREMFLTLTGYKFDIANGNEEEEYLSDLILNYSDLHRCIFPEYNSHCKLIHDRAFYSRNN